MNQSNTQESENRISYVDVLRSDFWNASGATCIGGRSENQDSFFVKAISPTALAVSVCDGMGGMNGGQIASGTALMSIMKQSLKIDEKKIDVDVLRGIIEKANTDVYNTAVEEPSLRGMGTTATLLILTGEAAFIAHVGDSRIYRLRGGRKIYRTFDHSKVFEMVAAKIMTEEEARCSSFSNIITKALGIRPKVEVTVEKIPYKRGDRFILCSDGIWNCLPEPEVLRMFNKEELSPEKEVRYLMETVDGMGFEKGGKHDNLTCAVVDVFENSEFQYGFGYKFRIVLEKIITQLKKLLKFKNKGI